MSSMDRTTLAGTKPFLDLGGMGCADGFLPVRRA